MDLRRKLLERGVHPVMGCGAGAVSRIFLNRLDPISYVGAVLFRFMVAVGIRPWRGTAVSPNAEYREPGSSRACRASGDPFIAALP